MIASGDFVVGFMTSSPAGVYPADQDRSTPSQGNNILDIPHHPALC